MKELSPFFITRSSFPGEESADAEFTVLSDDEPRIDLLSYWRTIRKRLWIVIAIPALLVTVIFFKDLMAPRQYTAEATLLIRSQPTRIIDQAALGGAPGGNPEAANFTMYKTEYELLRSRRLAAKVVAAENLAHNDAFTGADRIRQSSVSPLANVLANIEGTLGRLIPAIVKPTVAEHKSETDSQRATQQALIQSYLDDVKITPIEDTELVKVAVTSADAALSADLANAHVREFVRQHIELSAEASKEAETFLEQKLAELKHQVEESELALNNYRRDKDIIPGLISVDGKEDVILERLNKLSQQLQDEHLKTIELGAQAALIDEGRINALPAVIESALIQKLKGDLDALHAQYTSMASELKPSYPPMRELQAKINRTQDLLRDETASVAASVRAAYSTALRKEESLQGELDHQKKFALGLNDAAVQYVILQREADTNRQLYDAVLKRMKDVSITADLETSNISLVDGAVLPLVPSSPKRTKDLVESGIIGLALAIALAFLLDHLDNTLRSQEDSDRYLRIPTLAVIPEATSAKLAVDSARREIGPAKLIPRAGSEMVATYGGNSILAESYRTLRTALLLSRPGSHPKTTLITSALPREGKTTVAINTAAVLAHTGARVLLIDADLRRPQCHKVLALRNHYGLTEMLTGSGDNAITPTRIDNLFLLSSGRIPPSPSELLGSHRMKQLLDELSSRFNYIVIDSSPVMLVSDALSLSTMVEGVVLVADSMHTPKPQVRAALARLRYAHAKVLGLVLNKVGLHKFDSSYYRYYEYCRSDSEADEKEIFSHGSAA